MFSQVEAGDVIRHLRIRAGLSQAALAARAGTSQPVISAYEHGRRDPTVATLRKLVAAAGARLELRTPVAGAADLAAPLDDREHARRLLDALALADAIPHRRTGPLRAPRMVSRRASRT